MNPIDYEINVTENDVAKSSADRSIEDLDLKRHHSDEEIGQPIRTKQSRRSDIAVNDITTKDFGGDCHEIGI